MLGYKLPFDRHDWIVDRCGREVRHKCLTTSTLQMMALQMYWNTVPPLPTVTLAAVQVRYVIDFYNAAPLPNMPVAMHLDARPALDSLDALADRLRMQWRFITSS